MIKVVFVILGAFSLVLGILGIVIPGLPTTPFLLLTAGLWIRSSPRIYEKLVENKHLGPYILNYQRRKGLTRKQKIYSILSMWVMISISAALLVHTTFLKIILLAAGITGSVVVWFVVPFGRDESL